jgi:hypothetical protein
MRGHCEQDLRETCAALAFGGCPVPNLTRRKTRTVIPPLRSNSTLAVALALWDKKRSVARLRMPELKEIKLNLDPSANLNFRWQMCFNRFSIETIATGKIVNFAYVSIVEKKEVCAEVVPVFISDEGLEQLKRTSHDYISGFADVEDPGPEIEQIPSAGRRFSPLFSNHLRLSRSGGTAEIVLSTLMLTFLADEARGSRKPGTVFPMVPVALLHSSIPVHYRFVCQLLDTIEPENDE